ncbi:hypothetical protein RJ640_004746 [Escallonia rubra]|uniref:Uncharacterized protein n=1 Tax=Escallonia rubra TaxID=112253 RepID=A0AA88RQC8_9ASTE|nr:hypothetical protein RJ640_004746 [Escallonia rubra]
MEEVITAADASSNLRLYPLEPSVSCITLFTSASQHESSVHNAANHCLCKLSHLNNSVIFVLNSLISAFPAIIATNLIPNPPACTLNPWIRNPPSTPPPISTDCPRSLQPSTVVADLTMTQSPSD